MFTIKQVALCDYMPHSIIVDWYWYGHYTVFRVMLSQLTRISVILFSVFWFGVFLPGHKRGIVLLPGATASTDTSCHTSQGKSCCHSDTPETPAKEEKSRTGGCAVCFHMAMLGTTPWFILYLPDYQLLTALEAIPYRCFYTVASLYLPHGRDPPICVA